MQKARSPPVEFGVSSFPLINICRRGGCMAYVFAYLTAPVTARVVDSFGSFQKGEQVVINRVTDHMLMVGVADRGMFLPFVRVNDEAQEEIKRQIASGQGVLIPGS